MYTPE
jgi:hypothetical protein